MCALAFLLLISFLFWFFNEALYFEKFLAPLLCEFQKGAKEGSLLYFKSNKEVMTLGGEKTFESLNVAFNSMRFVFCTSSDVLSLYIAAGEQPWTSSPHWSALSSSASSCAASPPVRPPCCVRSGAPARTCCRPTRCSVPRRASSSCRPISTGRRRSSDWWTTSSQR